MKERIFDFIERHRMGIGIAGFGWLLSVLHLGHDYLEYRHFREHLGSFEFFFIVLWASTFTVVGYLYDRKVVSERAAQKAEEALKETNIQLQTLVNAIPDTVFFKDARGRHLLVNRAAGDVFGLKQEEVEGKTVEEILPPDVAKHCRKDDEEVMKNKKPVRIEEHATDKFGNKITLDTIKVPLYDDEGNAVGLVGVARDITERKEAEEQITASLKEKEILLREVHHRVKNNMQVISSMMGLQSGAVKDKKYAGMFEDSQDRIKAMALIHEKLYGSGDLTNIDVGEYIKSLAEDLFSSYWVDAEKIALKTDIRGVRLRVDTAINCGLIINDLVSNSLKHAFPEGKSGEIKITFRKSGKKGFELVVSDNGVGMPEDLDFRNTDSLGLQLVTTMVEYQLKGSMELNRDGGTEFRIKFKEKED